MHGTPSSIWTREDSWTMGARLEALRCGTELVLPSDEAARALRRAYDEDCRAAGQRAWQTARTLSWGSWTRSLWNNLVVSGTETRLLLNTAQELQVWRDIVATDKVNGGSLASAETLAALCQSAWALACAYRCTGDLRASATVQDSRTFALWAEEFARRCKSRDLLSAHALDDALAAHIRSGALPLAAPLHLVGFDSLDPAQAALLEAAQASGAATVSVSLRSAESEPQYRRHTIAPDEASELRAAARWVRNILVSGRTSRDEAEAAAEQKGLSRLSVAVLLPGPVDAVRGEMESVFREILAPELQAIGADLSSTPWAFSGGPSLSSLRLAGDLLDLARWTLAPLPLERISALLVSPYFAGSGDHGHSRFDAHGLRQVSLLRPELDLPDVEELDRRFAAKHGSRKPVAWLRPVRELASSLGSPTVERTYAEWTEFVRRLARAAGWPGSRALTATEFEATRAWDGVLDLVATLDFGGRRVPFGEALGAIERTAQSTPFAPPSSGASIRVMSLDEAEGQSFDAAVLLRATDTAWPAPEGMNPLLGWPLQRRLRMPGSDSADIADRARLQAESLLARCPRLLVLSPAENRDGPVEPSSLIAQLGVASTPFEDLLPPEIVPALVAEELVADADPIPDLRQAEVHGGANLLKLQAACGFLAFAELRLAAAGLQSSASGLDARESGSVLHAILQLFWEKVQTQDNLRAMPMQTRSDTLAECIRLGLRRAAAPQSHWDQAYVEVLSERLQRVLSDWLEGELEREPFTVLEQEHKSEITVGPLTLKLRIDRIDQVADGVVLVDYKTGAKADPRLWLGPRPEEPQLPLYSLLPESGELRGVAFARVRAGNERQWTGYTDRPGLLPKGSKVVDLEAQTAEWRETLESLASDFFHSRAEVQPKNFAVNCARCAQRLLCRLDPASLQAAQADDEAEEADTADV